MDTPTSASLDGASQYSTKLFYFGSEFPSDDPADLFRRLQQCSKRKQHRCLATFIDEATAVIREEFSKLPQPLKECIPSFQTVLSLADNSKDNRGLLGGAMESALLCIADIALFIGHFEAEGISFDLSKSTTTLSGLSIGLLAAAAVSASSSLYDLALIGAEAVRVSFRLGVHVSSISQGIEEQEPEGDALPWAYVVTGLTPDVVQQELDRYNTETVCANDSKIVHYQLTTIGICHAPHVYDSSDVDTILESGSAQASSRSQLVKLPLLSTQTGKRFAARTVVGLFEQVCTEILTGTIRLDEVTEGILDNVSFFGKAECQVLSFSNSLILKRFLDSIAAELPEVAVERLDITAWLSSASSKSSARSPRESKLAIVGMSCRLPGGVNNLELFWQIMEQGRDVHSKVPADRFDISTHFDPSGETPNSTETPYGNFIDNPGLFDAGFFNMSPKEAEQTDPMHRLALVTAYEALEMAGYAPNRTPSTMLGRVGTYYGQASDDWRELNAGQNIGTYGIPGGERAFANGRINYFFKFGGPSFNIDTACSSGLAAVNAACSALWAGEADTVIAGGLNVITSPDNYAMLCRGHFLSKTGQCKVWDSGADGYCRADGVGSVVIKRLEDAEADNDNIIATICAAATNHSANAASITQPHAGAQKDNYRRILHDAGVNPLEVSYVELHGTGTQVGDAVESESVADVFAPLIPRRRADQRLHLGAVKSNIGHGEAAAGIASLLKVLLVYQKNQIPPHIGIIHEINPVIAKVLENRNAGLAIENTLWPKVGGKKRYALVNSFGAHGGNTTILLEDGPEKIHVSEDTRSHHPVTISAKSKNSLKGNLEALLRYLDQHTDTDLGDLSYTTCARRIHHSTRIATSVSSIPQLRKFLESSLENSTTIRPVPVNSPLVVFAFTGQGAFYKGISSQLYKEFPFYQSQIIELDRRGQQLGYPSIIPAVDGSLGDDISPLLTQVATVAIEIALAKFWEVLGVKPSAVIGHSLGEYAALAVAGVISASDAIFLVGKRAELMLKSCTMGSHSMLSVRASPAMIEACEKVQNDYEVSCINGPEDTVISGDKETIAASREALEASGLKCTLLQLPYAFHTGQLDPVLQPFEQVAKHVTFKAPNIPVISPLLSTCVFDGKTLNAQYLRRASRETVNFFGALEAAQEMGIIDSKTTWVDVGPHPFCGAFIRNSTQSSQVVPSLRRDEDNFTTISNSLAFLHCEGVPVCWNEYFRPVEKSHRLLTLEHYAWNQKDYWIPYMGTWTLDKAYPKGNTREIGTVGLAGSALRTSSIHQIISEQVLETTAEVTALADIMHPDLLASIKGHTMNGHGVASLSIWADMALAISDYLYKRLLPKAKDVNMNLSNLEVLHAQIANTDTSSSQLLQLRAKLDLSTSKVDVFWFDEDEGGGISETHYASAAVHFENAAAWTTEWNRMEHLVNGRIEALQRMASEGQASKLSSSMAYTLFKNVVDYADKYRGMKSVVIKDNEAFADITLVNETHGKWHTPPHWIDSVVHIGGFVLNGSDTSNTKDYFYVTPGWDSYRLAKPLEAGGTYRSYVRMFPSAEPNMYVGDVYVLQDNTLIGMTGQMKFRKVPRLLMNKFFSPRNPNDKKSHNGSTAIVAAEKKPSLPAPGPVPAQTEANSNPNNSSDPPPTPQPPTSQSEPKAAPSATTDLTNPVVADCMKVIARETGLDPTEFHDEASFVELGVDSLMSLVLSEKFRAELQLEINSSLFIECPNIGELKAWLEEYC
ncbi:putative polyketide synthase [Phaeomoniella chlamydospora]|uniref:Putative polyketide synthase n=1 Tax=Phaeomoniella chlamydospora TaxID=158046 RepID=A0A0G2FSJ5_PHACM|nr:putative polyketide synthase [Phaeomoniella chlamydospora]